MSVAYMTHPLIKHKITMLRKETTGTLLRKSRSSWAMRRCPTCQPETFW